MRDPTVSLGDLLEALVHLRPDSDTAARVRRMLGIAGDAPLTQPMERKPRPKPPLKKPPIERDDAGPETAEPEEILPMIVRRLEDRVSPDAELSLADVPEFPPATAEGDEPLPPFLPLLRPHWTRAILGTALATPAEEGVVNVPRVIDILARNEPLTALPRLHVPTLRRGAHVLADAGPSMMPFVRDTEWWISTVRRVAGRERITVQYFTGVPSRGVLDADGSVVPHVPPSNGAPVILLTDLGVGAGTVDPPSASEWIDFAQSMRRSGSTVIAFVPYPPSRWPRDLARSISIVQWDRSTHIGRVRAALARAGAAR